MKYYAEEKTRDLRLSFEDEVLAWPHVKTKRMFGCPCYEAQGKLFAFLVTNGLVVTRLSENDREMMSHGYRTSFFRAGRRAVKNWVKISIQNNADLRKIMPFVRKSYEAALKRTEI